MQRKKNTRLLQNIFNVLDYRTTYFLTCQVSTNMVQVIKGKIIYSTVEQGKRKLLRVSGRFELSRVRVAEGKIAVNV